MDRIPGLALSVRQPWAWAILHAGKDIENRSGAALRHFPSTSGPIALHASSGMTRAEYEDAAEFMETIGVRVPPAADLPRGALVGWFYACGVVDESTSPWFFGPRGLVIGAVYTLSRPVPVRGALGLFDWRKMIGGSIREPAAWMLKGKATGRRDADLFDGNGA